jgi:hypothetical protein
MKPIHVLVVVLATLVSCGTPTPPGAEKPVRYAAGVQVALYDSEKRSPTTQLEVYQSEKSIETRPFRIIAMLTRNGHHEDEANIVNAIAWRARQLGAEGLILLPTVEPGRSVSAPFVNIDEGHKGEPIFRAHAIVFTAKATPVEK